MRVASNRLSKVASWGALVALLRVAFIGIWYAAPGDSWVQLPGYFLMMLNLPELIVLKALDVSPRSPMWPWLACLLVACGSYVWTYVIVWLLARQDIAN